MNWIKFEFVKVFTKGHLAGIRYEDSIHFEHQRYFDNWIRVSNKYSKLENRGYYVGAK